MPGEGAEVVPEPRAQALRSVLVHVRQRIEQAFDGAPDLLPVEAEIRVLPLEQIAECFRGAFRAAAEHFERFRPRVECEQHALLNGSAARLPLAMHDGQLVASPPDVRHQPPLVRHFVSQEPIVVQERVIGHNRLARSDQPTVVCRDLR